MNPLDDREQRLSGRAALVAGAAFVALYATTGFTALAYVVGAGIGVVLAGLLHLAARSRRRMPTGLAAVLVGLGPWGAAWVLGAPFLALGGWLLFRGRPRERARPARAGGEAGADGEGEGGGEGGRPAPARGARRRRRAGAAEPAPEARRRPAASKRYTPPAGR